MLFHATQSYFFQIGMCNLRLPATNESALLPLFLFGLHVCKWHIQGSWTKKYIYILYQFEDSTLLVGCMSIWMTLTLLLDSKVTFCCSSRQNNAGMAQCHLCWTFFFNLVVSLSDTTDAASKVRGSIANYQERNYMTLNLREAILLLFIGTVCGRFLCSIMLVEQSDLAPIVVILEHGSGSSFPQNRIDYKNPTHIQSSNIIANTISIE